MLSGQGSQYYQMGRELYDKNETFRYWMDHCNNLLTPLIQTSITDILYKSESKSTPFDRLFYSNPALMSIEYSIVKVLEEMDIKPDYLLGYSLGEIISSVISGVITLEDGLRLVVKLSKFAEEKSPSAKMLAIMSSKMILTDYPEHFQNCWLTGSNFEENFVVCGLVDKIISLQQFLTGKGLTTQLLPVKYGFHTELINPFESDYKRMVAGINLSPEKIPVISSLKTSRVNEITIEYLWEVIRYPINFQKAIENLIKEGDYTFIDAGPSGTLATFVKYILSPCSNSVTIPTINQFGRDVMAIEKLRDSFVTQMN